MGSFEQICSTLLLPSNDFNLSHGTVALTDELYNHLATATTITNSKVPQIE